MNLLFIEATRFAERVQQLGAEENLWKLEDLLCENPEAGPVIQGAGGFRKIRMGLPGRGKRGGCRVIYLYLKMVSRIYFVFLYPKNEAVELTPEQKKQLKLIAKAIYEEVKKGSSLNG